jgi:hypothetical protein
MTGDEDEDYPYADDFDAPPVVDLARYVTRAREVFAEIEAHFGRTAARRVFSWCARPRGEPPSPEPLDAKKQEILELLQSMAPFANKDLLAQELAEKNKIEPGRYGSGATTMGAMRKYILRAEREAERRSPNLSRLLDQIRRVRVEELKRDARRRLKGDN